MGRLGGKVAISAADGSEIGPATVRCFAEGGPGAVCADITDTAGASVVAEVHAATHRDADISPYRTVAISVASNRKVLWASESFLSLPWVRSLPKVVGQDVHKVYLPESVARSIAADDAVMRSGRPARLLRRFTQPVENWWITEKAPSAEGVITVAFEVTGFIRTIAGDRAAQVLDGVSRLTAREQVVLRLVAAGLHARQIAEQLGISERTVEAHRHHLMRVLDIHSLADCGRLIALLALIY